MRSTSGLVAACALSVLIAMAYGFLSLANGALGDKEPRSVVLVVSHGLVAGTLFHGGGSGILPVNEGIPGLMNTSTAGGLNRADTYATMAFGTRAVGGTEAGNAVPSAKVRSGSADGWLPPAEFPGIKGTMDSNARDTRGYGAKPGILPEVLERAGVRLAVFGNADEGGAPHREVALFGVRRDGTVREADFGVNGYPTAIAERVSSWLDGVEASGSLGFAVVEAGTGDQARKRMASIFNAVKERGGTGFVFASPGPADGSRADSLMPVMLHGMGTGLDAGGVLASPSTRRTGLITNTDLVPTCLEALGVAPPQGMSGRAAFSVKPRSLKGRTPAEWLLDVRTTAVANTAMKTPVVTILVLSIITCFLYFTAWFLGKVGAMPTRLPVLPWFPLLVIWWPSLILLLAYGSPATLWGYGLLTAVGLLPAPMFGRRLAKDPKRTLTVLAFIAIGLILADQLSGGALAARALLSYDPQYGSRFYGLGNEYMGFLIGAVIAVIGANQTDNGPRVPDMVLMTLGLAVVIGLPMLGANVGGLITVVLGLGIALLIMLGREPRLPVILGLMALAFLAVTVMSAIDSGVLGEGSSHLGRMMARLGSQGVSGALLVMSRKMQMNLRIMSYTPWSYVYVLVLVHLFWLTRPGSRVRLWMGVLGRYPFQARALRGALVASATAFLFNDSGFVASSLLMVFPFFGLAFMMLSEGIGHADNGS